MVTFCNYNALIFVWIIAYLQQINVNYKILKKNSFLIEISLDDLTGLVIIEDISHLIYSLTVYEY